MNASHKKLRQRDALLDTLGQVLSEVSGYRAIRIVSDRSLQPTMITETCDREAHLVLSFEEPTEAAAAKNQRRAFEAAIQAAPEFALVKTWKRGESGSLYPVVHYSAD